MNSCNHSTASLSLRAGDILAFSGATLHSDLINLCTYGWPRWSISHVGVLGHWHNDLLVFEATTHSPDKCVIQKAYVRGSQAQWIDVRISHYHGRIWHYPLVRSLSLSEQYRLANFLKRNIGKPYDTEGSLRAGARLWADIQAFLHEESIASLFCSEWVAAAHRHIGRFETKHVGKWSPNALIREERKRGILGTPVRIK